MRQVLFAGAVAGSAMLTSPAMAAWEVYQSGVAGTMALAGAAVFTVECLDDDMIVGIYDLTWPFDHAEAGTVTIDGVPHAVRHYGSGDRIVLADVDAADGLALSGGLVAALSQGDMVEVAAAGTDGIAAPMLTFRLDGAARAIELVAEDCRAGG